MSELARTDPRSPAEVEDDRAYVRLVRTAKVMSQISGLRKELQDKPDAVLAVCFSLQGYGLAITLPGINNSFDWIEGQLVPTTQLYLALAAMNGYQVVPVVRTAERAVARLVGGPEGPVDVEFTVADAINARRLDEWVEQWSATREGKRYKAATWVIKVNGQPTEGQPPAWVADEVNNGRVKRYEAWWSWRVDMMFKSAAKRAVRLAAPHLLLGGSDYQHPPARVPRPAAAIIEATEIPGPASPRVPAAPARASRPGGDVPPEVYDDLPEAEGADLDQGTDDEGRPF